MGFGCVCFLDLIDDSLRAHAHLTVSLDLPSQLSNRFVKSLLQSRLPVPCCAVPLI